MEASYSRRETLRQVKSGHQTLRRNRQFLRYAAEPTTQDKQRNKDGTTLLFCQSKINSVHGFKQLLYWIIAWSSRVQNPVVSHSSSDSSDWLVLDGMKVMMAVGHAFRRSRSVQLFLSLIFTGEVVFALARPHTSDNHDFTRFPLHGPSIGLFDRAVAYNQTRCGRHYTPTISRKGFSSSRVAYYPNSVSSFRQNKVKTSSTIMAHMCVTG